MVTVVNPEHQAWGSDVFGGKSQEKTPRMAQAIAAFKLGVLAKPIAEHKETDGISMNTVEGQGVID